jgi:hypothetical protein
MTQTASVWIDPLTIGAAARRAMNMAESDPDAPSVDAAAQVAIDLLVEYIGPDDLPEPVPTPVSEAATLVTVELYRRKDAVFGVLNTWTSADFGPVRISTDWLKAVESLVHPWMSDSFGIG